MDELLTARDVQDLLKIDRTTVYRMLKDGRLTGVKVGQQWRFARASVDALLSGDEPDTTLRRPQDVLPLHCIQPIQDVFADVAGIGALTVAPDGTLLTTVSGGCAFCRLMLASESGRRACRESWRQLSESTNTLQSRACHAGLCYACAPILVDDEPVALLVAGQVYAERPDPAEAAARVQVLAAQHAIDPHELAEAASEIPTLDPRSQALLGHWLQRVAQTFEMIAHERALLVGRLQRIAEMTVLD